ncbi:hypothetical protein H8356DRAFT_1324619 [Neocallimastix lanati (nom. inval.)]|nr:hypothetical protein H8356DRAFT_1324619 [Neocallimastix sp. JGI-2020a]
MEMYDYLNIHAAPEGGGLKPRTSYLINGHISTIININPLQEFYNETLTVLSFSSTVKEVALIVARIDSGLQTIKRPPIITPKTYKLFRDESIKIENNKGNIITEKSNYIDECVLAKNKVCQLVDSFKELINKLKNILSESEIYKRMHYNKNCRSNSGYRSNSILKNNDEIEIIDLEMNANDESENIKINKNKNNKNTKIDSNKNNNININNNLKKIYINIKINNDENNISMIIDTNKIDINEKNDINGNLEINSNKNDENNKINSNETI